MKVKATRPTYVESRDGKVLLKKGESADVDGRTYGSDHRFIVAGYLVAESKPEPKRKPKPEPTPEPVEVETDGHTDT